ncbi:MAG: sodium:proton antiporter [Pseudomonadota bacterium]
MVGEGLSLLWAAPFAGLLLSLAILPVVASRFWHRFDGYIAAAWCAAIAVPMAVAFGPGLVANVAWHVALEEYLPFIALLLALYTTAGGVLVTGRLVGTPAVNTAILAVGTLAASVMGTTGASMVLLRPLIRANAFRRKTTHSFVFFIFLVSNIGGALTPLGDPPLYLGFLQGVSFFWTTQHLAAEMAFCAVVLLFIYWLLDRRAWAAERPVAPEHTGSARLGIQGWANVGLLGLILLTVLAQGVWRPGSVDLFGVEVGVERLAAMAVFLGITILSAWITPRALHDENGFDWGAMKEVAVLFAAIFLTMAPVLAILRAGSAGAAAGLVALTSDAAGQPLPCRARCPPSSTMRRPTCCSSTSPAATRRR